MYSIVYNSLTGNTKMLADTIKSVLPDNDNDDVVFVGFWTDKGNADSKTIEYLKLLRNKKIFLFGTCGFGGSVTYFDRILTNVKSNIDLSNEVITANMDIYAKVKQNKPEKLFDAMNQAFIHDKQ